jgi:16S rRNA (cytosine967-C5)-methyltransferase
VNAVLKKISKQAKPEWQALNHPRLNTPDWLWESWEAAYGAAEAQAIATAHLREAPTDITLKESSEWLPASEGMTVEKLSDFSLRLSDSPSIPTLEGFTEGRWWVQDYAASLPVQMMGDVAGKEVLDICAAPGGKTAQLTAMGAKVTALDISENRLKRLRENLGRLQLSAEIITVDVMKWQPPHLYDAILLDVDNGPVAMVQEGNGRMYQADGLAMIGRVLKPGGCVAFWSASGDPAFVRRLAKAGFAVQVEAVKAYAQAKRKVHTIFLGRRK